MNSDAEIAELRAMGDDISGATVMSPWEPSCVARAFATRRLGEVVFTMQMWIDLDVARSPLLTTGVLETEADLVTAGRVFGLDFSEATDDQKALCAASMERAVREAFEMGLTMRHPEATGGREDDGFGTWLPLFAFLTSHCGFQPGAAKSFEVGQAFAQMAATRSNEGWDVAGTKYALRDVGGID